MYLFSLYYIIPQIPWDYLIHFWSHWALVIRLLICLYPPVASFTKEVNWWLAKRPLVFNGRLANRQLTSLVKEATEVLLQQIDCLHTDMALSRGPLGTS